MSTAPKAVGPYSPIRNENGFLFCSGQIGINPENGELQTGIEAQTKQVLENLQSILQSEGSDLSNVVKTTVFLARIEDYAKVNEIYATFFTENNPASPDASQGWPARSAIGVQALPKGALIEIEAIAIK